MVRINVSPAMIDEENSRARIIDAQAKCIRMFLTSSFSRAESLSELKVDICRCIHTKNTSVVGIRRVF